MQALPGHKFRLEFTSAAHKAHIDRNGLDFRGVNITPFPAYERIVRVLVDRAPLPLSDDHFISALSPYSRVVSVKSLAVRGFPSIRSGTRMVSMSVLKPIPPELTIASFPCSVRYQGQPKFCFRCRSFGHFGNSCPTWRRARPATRPPTVAAARSATTRQFPSAASAQRASPPASQRAASPVSSTRPALEGDVLSAVVRSVQPPLPAPSDDVSIEVQSTNSVPALAALFSPANAAS